MKHVALRYYPQGKMDDIDFSSLPETKLEKLIAFLVTRDIICVNDGAIIVLRHGFGWMVKVIMEEHEELNEEWSLMTSIR